MIPQHTSIRDLCWKWAWAGGLVLAVFLGAFLRLAWVNDMEYKREEAWTFERTQNVGKTESFPWLGMPNSVEVPHPGMSVWVFLGLGKIFGVEEPTDLGRACQIANVGAILLLTFFVLRVVPKEEREPWLWAIALVSVNPLSVVLHRKIWPPSILPIFVVFLLISWWFRDRRWGAAVWGFAGVLLWQVHPAGLFVACGFALWAVLFDRHRVSWLSWFAGSLVGAIPLIPWLRSVWMTMGEHPLKARQWVHMVELKFWTRWVTEPFGISVHYSLDKDFSDFLSYPLFLGQPTYFVGLLHVVLAALAGIVIIRGSWRLLQERGKWVERFIGRESQTAFTQNACLWGFGILFTASCLPIHRHYMVITFPLMFLWVARLAIAKTGQSCDAQKLGRSLLFALCVTQFLLSVSFLGYIHANQRFIRGDYGTPYGAQVKANLIAHGN
jgi:hypothetical protein